jgi:hypothetical protein
MAFSKTFKIIELAAEVLVIPAILDNSLELSPFFCKRLLETPFIPLGTPVRKPK